MDEIKGDVQRMVKRRKDSGFTLIELMIVIAVIGILAIVLVPKFGSVKTDAKLAGVHTNYRSVVTSLQGHTFTDNESVYTYLNTAFVSTGSNAIINPIDTTLKIVSNAADTAGSVIVDSAAAAPSATTTVYKGAVVVKPNLTGGTGTITIYGCDEKGNLIPNITEVLTF